MVAVEPRLAGHRVISISPDTPQDRAVVEGLIERPLTGRSDLVGVQGPHPGSGRPDGEFWQGGRWFLKSRSVLVFEQIEDGLRALERLRLVKHRLAELVPARHLLALLQSPEGGVQLWTVAPRLVTLREQLDSARDDGDPRVFSMRLHAFAHCLGTTLRLAAEDGLTLDANPANFASQGGRIRYLDDDVAVSSMAIGVEDAFLARFSEYPGFAPEVWRSYTRRFVDESLLQLTAEGVLRLRLAERLAAAAQLRKGVGDWAVEAARLLDSSCGRSAERSR